ncbi:MAG TPA: copper homeostasis membrane protein CopD [Roseiarcus sp.]|nr:copper homeostasis membrane protein CopD [Roseiarcus sp.]
MTALALCRFAHFMAAMLGFGSSAFLWLYTPVDLRRALAPKVRRLALAASVVALVTAVLWLALEAASMSEDWGAAADPGAIAAVLTDNEFGRAWIAHLAFAAAFVAAAVFAPRDAWGAIAVLSGLMLASLALVGHAAMQTGVVGALHRANHAVHLLTAGAWLGGLIPFAMCRGAYAANDLRKDAVVAMMRFSFTGHFVVAAIVATGIVNIALISGHPPLPPTTPYRALLDIKIGVVAIMILLALFNRYALTPRLNSDANALAALRLTSRIEVALGTIVVALVSLFALLDPA